MPTTVYVLVPDRRDWGQPACPKVRKKYEEEMDINIYVMYICMCDRYI
jgi:hypothetical protein